MRLEKHVTCAIDDFGKGDVDSALMHACFAVDGTAKRQFGIGGRKNYKQILRDHYWIMQAMMGCGVDISETIWRNIELKDDRGEIINNPDIADVVYHVFRCNHAHANDVPKEYTLTKTIAGEGSWWLGANVILMPDVIILALLAVAVFSKANVGSVSSGDYYLECGGPDTGTERKRFVVKDWWGKEDEVKSFVQTMALIKVKIEKLEILTETRSPGAA